MVSAAREALDLPSSLQPRLGGYTRRLEHPDQRAGDDRRSAPSRMRTWLLVSVQAQPQQAAPTAGLKRLRESRRDEMTRLFG